MKKTRKYNLKKPRKINKPSSLSGSVQSLLPQEQTQNSGDKSKPSSSNTAGSKPRKSSVLERKFALLWSTIKGPELVEEYRFHPVRKWRYDFAHISSKVAVELQGGIWSGGRHGRGYGIVGDYEKMNESQFCGWTVIQLSSKQITMENAEKILELINKRSLTDNSGAL
jgi:very-short-patch-repair endonuclease